MNVKLIAPQTAFLVFRQRPLFDRKYHMKGNVFDPFSGGRSVEDISSFILSYYGQELHFLSLRIEFSSQNDPQK